MSLENGFNVKLNGEIGKLFEEAIKISRDDPSEVISEMVREYHRRITSPRGGIEQRLKITSEMTAIAYNYAKKVFNDEMRLTDAKIEISRLSGMNLGSAQDYIMDFKAMMNGKEYTRAMKNKDSEFFIESIYRDFGKKYFINAIEATIKHINYYESKSGTNLSGKRELIEKLKNKYGVD